MTRIITAPGSEGLMKLGRRQLPEAYNDLKLPRANKHWHSGSNTIDVQVGEFSDRVNISGGGLGFVGLYDPGSFALTPVLTGDFGLSLTGEFTGLPRSYKDVMTFDPYLQEQAPAAYAAIAEYFTPAPNVTDMFRYFDSVDHGTLVVVNGVYSKIIWVTNVKARRNFVMYPEEVVLGALESASSYAPAIGSDASVLIASVSSVAGPNLTLNNGSVLSTFSTDKARTYRYPANAGARETVIEATLPPPVFAGHWSDVSSVSGVFGQVVAYDGLTPHMAYIHQRLASHYNTLSNFVCDNNTVTLVLNGVFSEELINSTDSSRVAIVSGVKVYGSSYIVVYMISVPGGTFINPTALRMRTHAGTVVLVDEAPGFSFITPKEHHMDISADGVPAFCTQTGNWLVQVGSGALFSRPVSGLSSPAQSTNGRRMALAWTLDGTYLVALNGDNIAVFDAAGTLLYEGLLGINQLGLGYGGICYDPVGFFALSGRKFVSINSHGIAEMVLSIRQDAGIYSVTARQVKVAQGSTYARGVDDIRRPYN